MFKSIQQLFKPIPILTVLLCVYTITVISRVPHHVLNEISHIGRSHHHQHHHHHHHVVQQETSSPSSQPAGGGQHLGEQGEDTGSSADAVDDIGFEAGGAASGLDFDSTLTSSEEEAGASHMVAKALSPEEDYANITLPPIEVFSIEPKFAPRAGNIAATVRGNGFSAVTSSLHQIGRKLRVFIGDVPCDETRWVSDTILKCLIPTGAGTNLEVAVSPCTCVDGGEGRHDGDAEEAKATKVTFSYTEDFLKKVVNEKPELNLVPHPKRTGIQMNRRQLISPHNLEVRMMKGPSMTPPLGLGGGYEDDEMDSGRSSRSSRRRVQQNFDADVDADEGVPPVHMEGLSSYAILPEMAKVLPREDWKFRHSTCAVVGKSGSLFGSRLGSVIDRHSGVFRIDNAPSGSKYLADVGKKVTYQVLGSGWAEALLGISSSGNTHVARWWLDSAAVVLWSDASQSHYVQLKYLYPDAQVVMLSRELHSEVKRQIREFAQRLVSSGLSGLDMLSVAAEENAESLGSLLHATSMALQVCESVDIYGVFPRCGRHSRCRQTFFDDTELTAKEKLEEELEHKFLMALGALNLVNTTTPVKMRDDGKLIKHPSLSIRPSKQRRGGRGGKAKDLGMGKCDETVCTSSSSSSPFQCTKHAVQSTEGNTGGGGTGDGGGDDHCKCEKTWGGKYCERDLLELGSPSLAHKIMKGINLNFRGSLLMGKDQIKWRQQEPLEDEETGEVVKRPDVGYIALPSGTTRNRTVQGDFYEMNRHMYNLLPENDDALVSLLDNQFKHSVRKVDTCAVIGNSGSLLHNPLGHEIDNHTMVYRFNQAPTAGFEIYTGVRCTHESLNSAWAKALVDTIEGGSDNDPDDPNPPQSQGLAKGNKWRWRKKDTALVLFEMFDLAGINQHNREQNYNKDRWWKKNLSILRSEWPDKLVLPYNPLFVVWAYHRYGELKRRFTELKLGNFPGEKPMSGFYAILFLLQTCDTLDLYGFEAYMESTGSDLMGTKYHYFDDAVPRHNSHSFDLTQYIYRAISIANPSRLRIRS